MQWLADITKMSPIKKTMQWIFESSDFQKPTAPKIKWTEPPPTILLLYMSWCFRGEWTWCSLLRLSAALGVRSVLTFRCPSRSSSSGWRFDVHLGHHHQDDDRDGHRNVGTLRTPNAADSPRRLHQILLLHQTNGFLDFFLIWYSKWNVMFQQLHLLLERCLSDL
jgi:hypothetical protein